MFEDLPLQLRVEGLGLKGYLTKGLGFRVSARRSNDIAGFGLQVSTSMPL